MPFGHDKSGKARFGPKKPASDYGKSADKAPAKSDHEKQHGKPMAPHEAKNSEKHVTETHPGKTQPHPVTGVHAHHAHHTGSHPHGGESYSTHTHHDDGTVETKDNLSHDDMVADREEAFPGEQQAENEQMPPQDDAGFGEELGGVGGQPV